MKTAHSLLAALIFCSPLLSDANAQGFLSRFKGKAEKDKVLSETEIANQENRASTAFQKAESYEQAGKLRQARDAFRSIARSYPNTKVGAEAQYRVAQIRDREGDSRKAYDEYKTLITKYRSSPHFQSAIERQYAIAEQLRTGGRKGLFGVGATIQPTDLKEMYDEIAEAAPYTRYAPLSLMAIGALNSKDGLKMEAINSYQSVVDNYRGTPFAKDAQFQIYKLRGEAAAHSNSPSEDRAQVDAGLDFLAQNPDDNRADIVKTSLEEIEERSLEKMLKTGKFYEETGNPKSALVYYREIVKKPNSKYYAEASQRIEKVQQVIAGQEIEEKSNRFGALPSLPKIEAPKFRIGKKDDVLPLPASE